MEAEAITASVCLSGAKASQSNSQTMSSFDYTHTGTALDNELIGSSAGEWFYGLAGDDVIYGGNGNDYIDGGTGFDLAEFSGNDNWINLNKSKYQKTGDGRDKLVSIEAIFAGDGDDTLIGHKKEANVLMGGYGDDWIKAGKHSEDILAGGAGEDTFELSKGKGFATVADYESQDWIYINAKYKQVTYDTSGSDLHLYRGDDLIAQFEGMSDKELWHDGGKWWYLA